MSQSKDGDLNPNIIINGGFNIPDDTPNIVDRWTTPVEIKQIVIINNTDKDIEITEEDVEKVRKIITERLLALQREAEDIVFTGVVYGKSYWGKYNGKSTTAQESARSRSSEMPQLPEGTD